MRFSFRRFAFMLGLVATLFAFTATIHARATAPPGADKAAHVEQVGTDAPAAATAATQAQEARLAAVTAAAPYRTAGYEHERGVITGDRGYPKGRRAAKQPPERASGTAINVSTNPRAGADTTAVRRV